MKARGTTKGGDEWLALSPDHKKIIDRGKDYLKLRARMAGEKVVFVKLPPLGKHYVFTN